MRIAITGHKPDTFLQSKYTQEQVKRIINDIIWIMKKQYGNELIVNIGGELGTELWTGQACMDHSIRYNIYLPFYNSIHTVYWNENEEEDLNKQIKRANGIYYVDPNPNAHYNKENRKQRDNKMVDDASFVVGFWAGKKIGRTYNTLAYTLLQNKFVFNGLNDLKPLFNEDLEKGWTPPTMEV